jgi:hypothetical protein
MISAFRNKLRRMVKVLFKVSTNIKVSIFRFGVWVREGMREKRKWKNSREGHYVVRVEQKIFPL